MWMLPLSCSSLLLPIFSSGYIYLLFLSFLLSLELLTYLFCKIFLPPTLLIPFRLYAAIIVATITVAFLVAAALYRWR